MQLVVLGLNHKTVSVEVRERFAISVDNINKGLRHLDNYNESPYLHNFAETKLLFYTLFLCLHLNRLL